MVTSAHPALRRAPRITEAPLGVLEKMTLIIDAFTDGPECLLLEDLTEMTGLPRSTLFRLLRQCVELNWVEYGQPGYRLGPRLASPRGQHPERDHLRSSASVPLATLSIATGAVCHLSVIDGGMTYFLDKVGNASFRTIPSRVGARMRVTDSVSGLAMLAWMMPEQVDETVRLAVELNELERAALHNELHLIRQQGGVAVSPGAHRFTRINSMGVAVIGPRGPVAAISIASKGALEFGSTAPKLTETARQTAMNLFPDRGRRRALTADGQDRSERRHSRA
jgi:DNA-binding IclR family transcriptional regulator